MFFCKQKLLGSGQLEHPLGTSFSNHYNGRHPPMLSHALGSFHVHIYIYTYIYIHDMEVSYYFHTIFIGVPPFIIYLFYFRLGSSTFWPMLVLEQDTQHDGCLPPRLAEDVRRGWWQLSWNGGIIQPIWNLKCRENGGISNQSQSEIIWNSKAMWQSFSHLPYSNLFPY